MSVGIYREKGLTPTPLNVYPKIKGGFKEMPSRKKQIATTKIPGEEIVAQGNDLIRHARFQLTALEQNIIYFCISKIKANDKEFMRQTFTIKEFCEACGIEAGGNEYRRVKAMVKSVSDKSTWVLHSNGVESLVRWFDTYEIDHNTSTITAVLSQSIKPYLLGLIERAKTGGEGYTQALLATYLSIQSKYGKRLYEVLKSYLYDSGTLEMIYKTQILEYDLDELRALLNAEKYSRYQDLRRFVLETAVREIDELTDIGVTHQPIKKGRKIVSVQFIYQYKMPIELMKSFQAALNRLKKVKK